VQRAYIDIIEAANKQPTTQQANQNKKYQNTHVIRELNAAKKHIKYIGICHPDKNYFY